MTPLAYGILWNRLIAVVEEQAQTMIRTAFSTTVREAGDLSAGIFDLQGRMMAQAVTGTPGHVNSMMESVGHFLRRCPAETMRPGDHYITNDPWLGTGHLHDLTIVSPAFHGGRMVGLFANTAHVIDVGGLGLGPEARSVFEEGLYIPILKCFSQGVANDTFFDILRAATRLPVELEGDVYSLCACNDAGIRRLTEMMTEFALPGLDDLASHIFDRSRRATLDAIAALPPGRYTNSIGSDGYEAPITLHAAMTIAADGITVDFAGTSGLSTRGINVPAAYTRAYTAFGIKVAVAPDIPNNTASLEPFHCEIPAGCILNAPHPYPVAVRHVIGHLLPDLVMGCPARRDTRPRRRRRRVQPVEPALTRRRVRLRPGDLQPPRAARFRDRHLQLRRYRRPAARWTASTPRPSPPAVRTMPVEATEAISPLVFWRKELRPGSGGRRAYPRRPRPDHGDRRARRPRICLQRHLRTASPNPPRGRDGGGDGAPGRVMLKSGATLRPKGFQIIPDGDRLVLELPGGGGMGDPRAARARCRGTRRARRTDHGGTGCVGLWALWLTSRDHGSIPR